MKYMVIKITNEAIVFVHGLGDEASTIWKESVEKKLKKVLCNNFDLPSLENLLKVVLNILLKNML